MSKREWVRFAILLWCAAPTSQAQYSPPPQAYSLTETSSMFGHSTWQIHRDGSRIFVDHVDDAPLFGGGNRTHVRTLYDLDAHRSYTWDVNETSCRRDILNGAAEWDDPFARDWLLDITKAHPKRSGMEIVNGFTTEVLEIKDRDGSGKIWLDTKYGLAVKVQMAEKNKPFETVAEINSFNPAFPPASVFELPASCIAASKEPLPPTDDELLDAVTGGDRQNYADLLGRSDTAAFNRGCTIWLRVVRGETLEPILGGFQVALDTSRDALDGHIEQVALGSDGRVTFSRMNEVTDQLRDGVLRIPKAPRVFHLYVHIIGAPHDAEVMVYRQCFRREQVLLLVLGTPDPRDPIERSHWWLWPKAGKLVQVPKLPASETDK